MEFMQNMTLVWVQFGLPMAPRRLALDFVLPPLVSIIQKKLEKIRKASVLEGFVKKCQLWMYVYLCAQGLRNPTFD